jgi:hypothetical protein
MYGWNDYQPKVYDYFQGSDANEQIITLEKNLMEFNAKGQLAPPGFHAHLGMMYAQVRNLDRAAQEFMIEKKRFPESAAYMNFLLNKKESHKTVGGNQNDDIGKSGTYKNQTQSLAKQQNGNHGSPALQGQLVNKVPPNKKEQ